MTLRPFVYTALLVPFLVLTVYVLATAGLGGFYRQALSSPSTVLMGLDLVIALGLILGWMRGDARATGTPWLPYAIVALLIGVAGPLLYGIHRGLRSARPFPKRRSGERAAAA